MEERVNKLNNKRPDEKVRLTCAPAFYLPQLFLEVIPLREKQQWQQDKYDPFRRRAR